MLWKKTPASEKQDIMFCILCQVKIEAMRISAQATKLADKLIKCKSSSGVGDAPRKKTKFMKASVVIVHKLHCLAAFQAQLYIFTKVEKAKTDVRFAMTEEKFFSNQQKRIKGACTQLNAEKKDRLVHCTTLQKVSTIWS